MLKELKNIRSYNDMLKVLRILNDNLNTARLKLSRIANVSESSRNLTIGLTDRQVSEPKKEAVTLPDNKAIKSLSEYAAVINQVYENIDSIKIARHMAEREFGNMKSQKEYLASCDKMLKEAMTVMQEASKQIAVIANKHVPTKLRTMFKTLNEYIDQKIDQSMYSSKSKIVNAFPINKGGKLEKILVTMTLRFSDLKLRQDAHEKAKNFAYKTFSVTLTAQIYPDNTVTFHITAMPEFKIPGTYDPGKQVTESNVLDIFAKIISYYNFAMFKDRTPVPNVQEFKNFTKLKGIKRVKVLNDRITLLLQPNISEQDKHGAIGAVMTLLKDKFKGVVNFNINQDRSLMLNEKVKVNDVNPYEIEPFVGRIKTPLLNSDAAKIALNNDYDAFEIWYKAHVEEVNADNEKNLKRLEFLKEAIRKAKVLDEERELIKSASPKYRAMFDEYKSLDMRNKFGQFKPQKARDLKRLYDSYIKYGLESETIKVIPEASETQYSVKKEAHPVIHIELQAQKISAKDKSNWTIGVKQLNTLRDELDLSPKDVIELKKILFK